jgi:hypothetical protein
MPGNMEAPMETLTLKRAAPDAPGPRMRQAHAAMGQPSEPTKNWEDIMEVAKATLTFTPRGAGDGGEGPSVLVANASKVFCAAFGIRIPSASSANIQLPFERLFGAATERSLLMSIELSLLTGENLINHANLYRLDGKVSTTVPLLS